MVGFGTMQLTKSGAMTDRVSGASEQVRSTRHPAGLARGMDSISIVVCTYNRAHLLPDALQSLLRLDVPGDWQWDILVVDNRSSDATAQVVAELMKASGGRLHYVLEPEGGVAPARNCGVARSSGNWIAFFDDDQIANPTWLRELVEHAVRNNVRVVGGTARLLLPDAAPTDLPLEVRLLFGVGASESLQSKRPNGGNVLVHRSVFQEVGGFDTSLREGGEDTDFSRRLVKAGIPIGYQPKAIVHHRVSPGRLETPALLAASKRVGWGFCRRDRRRHGSLSLVVYCVARILRLALNDGFRYVRATLAGDQKSLLGVRINVAFIQGYCAASAAYLLPEAIKARLNLVEPSFRDELGRTSAE